LVEQDLFPGGFELGLGVRAVEGNGRDRIPEFGVVERVLAVAVIGFLVGVGGIAAAMEFEIEVAIVSG
jgi:hypothetical protein